MFESRVAIVQYICAAGAICSNTHAGTLSHPVHRHWADTTDSIVERRSDQLCGFASLQVARRFKDDWKPIKLETDSTLGDGQEEVVTPQNETPSARDDLLPAGRTRVIISTPTTNKCSLNQFGSSWTSGHPTLQW